MIQSRGLYLQNKEKRKQLHSRDLVLKERKLIGESSWLVGVFWLGLASLGEQDSFLKNFLDKWWDLRSPLLAWRTEL